MLTSRTGGILDEILSGGSLPLKGEAIPPRQLAYFRERLKGRIFSFIVSALKKQQREDPTITQAAIAQRLGRRPEQINRWLSGPSNMTIDTISDLVLAVSGGEPLIAVTTLRAAEERRPDAVQPPTDVSALASQGGQMGMPLQGRSTTQGVGASANAPLAESTSSARIIADLPTQATSASAKWDDLASLSIANSNTIQSMQPSVFNQTTRG